MVDSYLHPKVVSFINYFYDYVRLKDSSINMEILFSTKSIRNELHICISRGSHNTRKIYETDLIIYSNVNPQFEAEYLLDELYEEVNKFYGENNNGKIET